MNSADCNKENARQSMKINTPHHSLTMPHYTGHLEVTFVMQQVDGLIITANLHVYMSNYLSCAMRIHVFACVKLKSQISCAADQCL